MLNVSSVCRLPERQPIYQAQGFTFRVTSAPAPSRPEAQSFTDPVKAWLAVPENVAFVVPWGTVTEAGTLTSAAFVFDKSTFNPPAGAGALRVTVPVVVAPCETALGLNVKEAMMGRVLGLRRKIVPLPFAPPRAVAP